MHRRLSQDDMAMLTGMGTATYQRIDTGERVPDVSQLHRIAAALGVRPSELVRMVEVRLNGGGE